MTYAAHVLQELNNCLKKYVQTHPKEGKAAAKFLEVCMLKKYQNGIDEGSSYPQRDEMKDQISKLGELGNS